jgi:pimeloyl-ACP methyl ester carboxylesterase
VSIHFFHGLEDEIVPPSHLELYARAVPQARTHRLKGRDHQLDDDLSEIAEEISSR